MVMLCCIDMVMVMAMAMKTAVISWLCSGRIFSIADIRRMEHKSLSKLSAGSTAEEIYGVAEVTAIN